MRQLMLGVRGNPDVRSGSAADYAALRRPGALSLRHYDRIRNGLAAALRRHLKLLRGPRPGRLRRGGGPARQRPGHPAPQRPVGDHLPFRRHRADRQP